MGRDWYTCTSFALTESSFSSVPDGLTSPWNFLRRLAHSLEVLLDHYLGKIVERRNEGRKALVVFACP
jgi:hypothetical protein